MGELGGMGDMGVMGVLGVLGVMGELLNGGRRSRDKHSTITAAQDSYGQGPATRA